MKYERFWHSLLIGAERAEAPADSDTAFYDTMPVDGTQEAILQQAIESVDCVTRSMDTMRRRTSGTDDTDVEAQALAREGIRVGTIIDEAMKIGEYSIAETEILADMAVTIASEINRLALRA